MSRKDYYKAIGSSSMDPLKTSKDMGPLHAYNWTSWTPEKTSKKEMNLLKRLTIFIGWTRRNILANIIQLPRPPKGKYHYFLKAEYKYVRLVTFRYAWDNLDVIAHHLNVQPKFKLVQQKNRCLGRDR